MPASQPAPALLPRPKHLPKVLTPAAHATAAATAAQPASASGALISLGLEAVACAGVLRRELSALHITDGDVGAALGISRGEAGKMLAGIRQIYFAHLRRLARRLPASRPAIAAALASIVGGGA